MVKNNLVDGAVRCLMWRWLRRGCEKRYFKKILSIRILFVILQFEK